MAALALSLIEAQFSDPADQLRLDDELLASGNPVIRFWQTAAECVVLGKSGRPDRDADVQACRRASVPILRRSSGGGAVLLGPGCLNYALVLPLSWSAAWHDVRYNTAFVMDRICKALAVKGLTVEGASDLALDGRKVSGNAQRRTQSAILHHGTLLHAFDPARVELFLRPPDRQPAWRGERSHRDFLGNLPLSEAEIRSRLTKEWCSGGTPAPESRHPATNRVDPGSGLVGLRERSGCSSRD
jgi:lipoate-protein ligase A